jgi:hypothetical protein
MKLIRTFFPTKGVFLLSGIYELKPLLSTYVNDPLAMTSEEAEAMSPLAADNLAAYADNLIARHPDFRKRFYETPFRPKSFRTNLST